MRREYKARDVILYALILILFATLVGRLYYLQVIKGKYYDELSKFRSLRIMDIEPIRGRILDRNGIVLAENVPSFELVVTYDDVRNHDEEFNAVSKIIGVSVEKMEEIIKNANVPAYKEVVLKRGLTDKERISIEELWNDLPGFKVNVSSKRYYPFGSIGEAFLGYVGPVTEEDLKNDDFYGYSDYIGKQGVEFSYEKFLRGEKGQKEVLLDSLGRVQQVIYEKPPVAGSDVYLTIDIEIQKKLEDIIGDKTGVSIVMNDSGEIIAMVSHPSFDPNTLVQGISEAEYEDLLTKKAFLNRAIQASYPPGSTFKPVTLIAALETGTISPTTVINCPGYIYIGNRMFKDWVYPGAFGNQTPAVALANSSDVFFWQIGIKTGIENISKYAKILHIDGKTNVDIPFEISGFIPDPQWKVNNSGENWYIGDTANTSIGQGYVLVTPLSMATFYQSIANKGIAYEPHFVSKIISSGGNVVENFSKEILFQYNVKSETFSTVYEGLRGLANKPDMKVMRVNNLEVYAKTGSAELGDGSVHHWLISIIEAKDEKYIGLLFFEKSSFQSSHSLAPLMRDLWQSVLLKP